MTAAAVVSGAVGLWVAVATGLGLLAGWLAHRLHSERQPRRDRYAGRHRPTVDGWRPRHVASRGPRAGGVHRAYRWGWSW